MGQRLSLGLVRYICTLALMTAACTWLKLYLIMDEEYRYVLAQNVPRTRESQPKNPISTLYDRRAIRVGDSYKCLLGHGETGYGSHILGNRTTCKRARRRITILQADNTACWSDICRRVWWHVCFLAYCRVARVRYHPQITRSRV